MCIRYLAGNYDASAQAGEHAGESILDLKAWRAAALAQIGEVEHARSHMQSFIEEAKGRWRSDVEASDENIGKWLVDAFPIKNLADQNRLREGLQKAGLPV